MIGELYTRALAGHTRPEIEHADGTRVPLAVDEWLDASPGDASMLERCCGPTLDVGSGPGRLTVALAERGIPALGIDITPYAVQMARSAGALALLRDVFGHVPGAGRWVSVLLADGNIGIGGDPVALLRRIGELLAPGGQAIVEIQPPGTSLRREQVRLRNADTVSDWFPWAYVGADQIAEVAGGAGMDLTETWSAEGRWFAALHPVGLPEDPVTEIEDDVALDSADQRLSFPYRRARIMASRLDEMAAYVNMKAWMRVSARISAILICLAALTWLILILVRPSLDPAKIQTLPLIGGAWIVFVLAAWLLRKAPVSAAVPLILIGAFAVQIAALTAPPAQSSDLYRYIWDGRVQAAGVDPYAYPPEDKGVAFLRNEFLWSGTKHGDYVGCVQNSTTATTDPALSVVKGCSKLNRIWAPTIYPPVAEAYFFAVQLAVPADNSTTPIQAAAALCAIATTMILLFGLRVLGRDIRMAALWAWCPTVALEAGNNAHVDVLAVAITALAMLILARAKTEGRTILGGVLLGLGIATKMTPVLVIPSVLRRRWFTLLASAATAMVVVYAPHAMAVGGKIIGFLPGYLKQEGYTSGSRFGLLDLVFKDKIATGIAVLIMATVAYIVLRKSDPDEPWHGSVIMTATALAVATPLYQWYALLLIMLVALDGKPEWLGLAAGGYLYAEPLKGALALPNAQALGYGGGLALALGGTYIRYRLTRPRRPVPGYARLALAARDSLAGRDSLAAPDSRHALVSSAAPRSTPRPAEDAPRATSTPSGSTPSLAAEPAGTYLTAGTSAGA